MSHYTGPKARVNRRLGVMLYESSGAVRASDRRTNPPGMHTRGRRPSNYGLALREKQKIKHYYGLGERQLRRYFDRATRLKGNTGQQLLLICERRLDNVVRRAGFAMTRPQARQGVAHGHFLVNGVKVDKPSYMLRPGDVISVKTREKINNIYRERTSEAASEMPEWISVDAEDLTATVAAFPDAGDISLPVDANMVVEFLSR